MVDLAPVTPRVINGTPYIRSIPLYVILDDLASGKSIEDIAIDYFLDIGEVRGVMAWLSQRLFSHRWVEARHPGNVVSFHNKCLDLLGSSARVKIDRPLGSRHPEEGFVYPVNYGFLPGTKGADGEPIDAYVLGCYAPVEEFVGTVVGMIHRCDDIEDKLVVAPDDMEFTHDQIEALTAFRERDHQIEIILPYAFVQGVKTRFFQKWFYRPQGKPQGVSSESIQMALDLRSQDIAQTNSKVLSSPLGKVLREDMDVGGTMDHDAMVEEFRNAPHTPSEVVLQLREAQRNIDELSQLPDLVDALQADFVRLATRVWLAHSTIRADGCRVAGDDDLGREAFRILRRMDKINDRGYFEWEDAALD